MKQILVLDTNIIQRHENLAELSTKYELITATLVMNEIKNKELLEKIENLPFKIKVVNPTKESLKIIEKYCRDTGDWAVLSKPDIDLLAVACGEMGDKGELKNIRMDAPKIINYCPGEKRKEKTIEENASPVREEMRKREGECSGESEKKQEGKMEENPTEETPLKTEERSEKKREEAIDHEEDKKEESSDDLEKYQYRPAPESSSDDEGWCTVPGNSDEEAEKASEQINHQPSCVPNEEIIERDRPFSEDEDGEDGCKDAWITPQNYKEKYGQTKKDKEGKEKKFQVCIMSNDYAVQVTLNSS